MDRQKSCGNDRLQVVMRAFHRYKYDKSYGVLLALIPTMRSDFDRKYCMIYQICSVGNSCELLIENLFYTGAYILAGAPKIGKSFLVAQIAHHVSTGQDLWGYKTHQGTVLYLALED